MALIVLAQRLARLAHFERFPSSNHILSYFNKCNLKFRLIVGRGRKMREELRNCAKYSFILSDTYSA